PYSFACRGILEIAAEELDHEEIRDSGLDMAYRQGSAVFQVHEQSGGNNGVSSQRESAVFYPSPGHQGGGGIVRDRPPRRYVRVCLDPGGALQKIPSPRIRTLDAAGRAVLYRGHVYGGPHPRGKNLG